MRYSYDREPISAAIPHLDVKPTSSWITGVKSEFRGTEFTLLSKKLGFVIHYPGSNGFGRLLFDASAAMARIQDEYIASRGYSNGYNIAIDQNGGVAYGRGWYRSAANGSAATNDQFMAIFLLIDDTHPTTPAQILAAQRIVHYGRNERGYGREIIGHQQIRSTDCPGSAEALVRDGSFEPKPASWPENQVVQPPPPVLPPPTPPIIAPPIITPPPGVTSMKNLEVIQFVFGESKSAVFLADGATVYWIYNIVEGDKTYDIAKAWLDALGQASVRQISSLCARTMELSGPYEDTAGFLTLNQLGFRKRTP